jgi:hypothetical protein
MPRGTKLLRIRSRLVDSLYKLFAQFGETLGDRLREADISLKLPPDEMQKLAVFRGLLLVALSRLGSVSTLSTRRLRSGAKPDIFVFRSTFLFAVQYVASGQSDRYCAATECPL